MANVPNTANEKLILEEVKNNKRTATIKIIVASRIRHIMIIFKPESAPLLPNSKVVTNALGISATIPEKIINEIQLQITLCVICSPNHIKNIVPATIVVTVVILKNAPWLITKSA